jgi:general secretion pathway protein B
MSLILEALKKSEANRRLGEVPDLGTPFATATRRRNPLPFIAIAIVIAAGVGWWLLRTPTAEKTPPPAQVAVAVPTQPKVAPTLSKPGGPEIHPAHHQGLGMNAANVHMPVGDNPSPAANSTMPNGPENASRTATAATAATTPPPPGVKKAEAPVAAKQAAAAVTPPPWAKKPEIADAKVPAIDPKAAPPLVAAGTPHPDPEAARTANAPTAKDAPAPAQHAPAPAEGSAQPYNELAFSVRKDLPTIKLSMHVFATDPTQRFVILNDSRMVEGDTQDDLSVREIRPDGVVFEFRGQRFFYPRDGL